MHNLTALNSLEDAKDRVIQDLLFYDGILFIRFNTSFLALKFYEDCLDINYMTQDIAEAYHMLAFRLISREDFDRIIYKQEEARAANFLADKEAHDKAEYERLKKKYEGDES